MATKSSNKKSAAKKTATKPKVAAKKSASKKAKSAPVKKVKPAVKPAVKKKAAAKKTVALKSKKKVIAPAKAKAKKVIKVVNNQQKKATSAKKSTVKAVVKNKKSALAKTKKVKVEKKNTVKVPSKIKTIAPKVAVKQDAKAKSKTESPKNEIALKPVTKPILKKSVADAAASQRNLAIRARYKKVEIEYPVHSAKHILFSYLSTSSGLSEWFADKVNEKGDIMVFEWDSAQQAAKVLSAREDHHIRFRWLDMPEAIYFEFRVETDEITGDLALIITDFCEDESSIESTKNLWNSQIDKLFHVLGIH
jgi:hypothetical protein